jgi:nicotinate-nucleotide adenylyltransferase
VSESVAERCVGIFGGSFNPPHVAHVLAVTYALSTAPIDEILVVPVFRHPFAKDLTPFDDRLEMCRLAFGWLPRVSVSAVERDLGGDSLTLRTVEHLAAQHPTWALRLIVGSDVLPDLPKWHRFDRIAEIAPPLVLDRAGFSGAPDRVLLPDLSSTFVRSVLASGDDGAARRTLPRAVLEYIAARGLYGAHGPRR